MCTLICCANILFSVWCISYLSLEPNKLQIIEYIKYVMLRHLLMAISLYELNLQRMIVVVVVILESIMNSCFNENS